MGRKNAGTRANVVSLRVGSSFPAAWQSTLLPWFERVSLASLSVAEPVTVVTPSPSSAAFLRAKALEHSISLLGIKFLTPPRLRELLLADRARTLPLREHLRLLLAIAAETVAQTKSEDVNLNAVAKSVARAPDNLLRAFDRVSAAGWAFERVAPTTTAEITKRFRDLVQNCGFQMIHEADRGAMETAVSTTPRFDEVLLIGFTSAHWPLLPLLQSAVFAARRATVVLEYPRGQTRTADEAWIGTWEENFGAADQIPEQGERELPFADLIRAEEVATNSDKWERNVHFLVGLNATEQAQAISAVALKFLAEESCTRLGILFPHAGALPRLVSESLTHARILHCDTIGHLAPGEFEKPAWDAWLQMQQNDQLEPVLRFLETNPESLGTLSFENVRKLLRRAHGTILIDDINVLAAYCERQTEDNSTQIAKLLRGIKFLPANATLEHFLAETKAIFVKLKWNDRLFEIDQLARVWSDALPGEFSRAVYLQWLAEISNSFSIARASGGDHSYSRVHLLSYADAEAHEWSHLILAGLNQGEWPQMQRESGFLPDEQIVDLNARATRRGSQGEGHSVLEKGKTFLLGAQDQRRIALRQFAAALESADHGLAITASLLQESAPERLWNPSELFSQIYFATRKTPLSQETMSMLREQTHAWLLDHEPPRPIPSKKRSVAQTRVAYDERRKADVKFGEYEFALREPIDREITLRATEWDKVVKIPALIWLKKYLGVENEEPDLNQWTPATGTWVHDWLAQIGAKHENVFVDFPKPAQVGERFSEAAQGFRKMVVELCASAGRDVPDWWTSGWSNAFALGGCFASKLIEVEGWPRLAAEWNLDSNQIIFLNDKNKLRVRGRIDLILAKNPSGESRLNGLDLWIVDYKTGNVKSLLVSGRTPELRTANLRKKLVRGDAIQLGLYGLAARELGASDVDLSILSLRTDLDKPQLKIDSIAAFSDFWNELYQMQETGTFGLRGAIRNEFGFHPDYPLATLPIDKEFLDEKWVLTHPAFADDEEDRW
jgi:PD-(D/E)XK nuclease superfamily